MLSNTPIGHYTLLIYSRGIELRTHRDKNPDPERPRVLQLRTQTPNRRKVENVEKARCFSRPPNHPKVGKLSLLRSFEGPDTWAKVLKTRWRCTSCFCLCLVLLDPKDGNGQAERKRTCRNGRNVGFKNTPRDPEKRRRRPFLFRSQKTMKNKNSLDPGRKFAVS